MSELTDGIDGAFDILADEQGQATSIQCGPVTKTCILGPFVLTKELRDSGFIDQATNTAEIKRAAFVALGIVDRSSVKADGRQMKVMKIEDDPGDSVVRVHLRPERP